MDKAGLAAENSTPEMVDGSESGAGEAVSGCRPLTACRYVPRSAGEAPTFAHVAAQGRVVGHRLLGGVSEADSAEGARAGGRSASPLATRAALRLLH